MSPLHFGAANVHITSPQRNFRHLLAGDQLHEVIRQNRVLEGSCQGETDFNQALVDILKSPDIRARLYDLPDRFSVVLSHPQDIFEPAKLSVEGSGDFERSYGRMVQIFREEATFQSSLTLREDGLQTLQTLLDNTFTKLEAAYDEQAKRPD